MNLSNQIAKQIRDLYFGGDWTSVNLNDTLKQVTLQQATQQVHNLNTIAELVFHLSYYIRAVSRVLDGQPLEAHDKFSFDAPTIETEEDWQQMKTGALEDGERFAAQVSQLSEEELWKPFAEGAYGHYHRNIHGVVEHAYYHLGQIALVKKMVIGTT